MKSNIKLIFILSFVTTYLNAEVLVFSKAYELALKNAHSIKALEYQTEISKERLTQEKSRLYPQINLSGYYKKSEYTYYESNRNSLKQGLFNYGVSLKQSIYNRETYSRINIERSRGKLFNTEVELEKEKLAQTVFTSYLDLLKSNNRIKLQKSYLQYSKSRLQELNKKYEMHLVSKMDLLEMKIEYKSANIDLMKEKKIFKVHELKLKQLIGDVEYKLPSINLDGNILYSLNEMKQSVQNIDDFSSNLSLKKAKLELEVSDGEIDNAFSAHYPRLDLDGNMYLYDTDDVDIQAPYKETKSIMLTLNIPIYSGGLASARVREYEFKSNSINEEILEKAEMVQVQYDEYLTTFEASVESVSMYKDAYESALLYVDAIEQGYAHGLKSIIDVNDAKNKQYEVRYKYIENIYELVDSYIGLLIVTNNFENIQLLDKIVE